MFLLETKIESCVSALMTLFKMTIQSPSFKSQMYLDRAVMEKARLLKHDLKSCSVMRQLGTGRSEAFVVWEGGWCKFACYIMG